MKIPAVILFLLFTLLLHSSDDRMDRVRSIKDFLADASQYDGFNVWKQRRWGWVSGWDADHNGIGLFAGPSYQEDVLTVLKPGAPVLVYAGAFVQGDYVRSRWLLCKSGKHAGWIKETHLSFSRGFLYRVKRMDRWARNMLKSAKTGQGLGRFVDSRGFTFMFHYIFRDTQRGPVNCEKTVLKKSDYDRKVRLKRRKVYKGRDYIYLTIGKFIAGLRSWRLETIDYTGRRVIFKAGTVSIGVKARIDRYQPTLVELFVYGFESVFKD